MENIKQYEGLDAIEILNLYRNQHYQDGNMESGILANAINEVLPKLKKEDNRLHMKDYMRKQWKE